MRPRFRGEEVAVQELEMSAYLVNNKSTAISKIIFSVRSGTLDLKDWHPWKYSDNFCVMCKLSEMKTSNILCPARHMEWIHLILTGN